MLYVLYTVCILVLYAIVCYMISKTLTKFTPRIHSLFTINSFQWKSLTQLCNYLQCHVAAMVAASASVSYSSVNQYDGNRSIMWRQLNSCSSCDNAGSSFRRQNSLRTCRHHHHSHPHYHHQRRPAIRQNKRCTFATTTTTILPPNNGNSNIIGGNGNGTTTVIHHRHHSTSPSTSFAVNKDNDQTLHQVCQSQSSNSSNTSSIRVID